MKKLTIITLILSILFSNINCKEKIINEAPEKPTVVSPIDNSTIDKIPSYLRWECVDNENDKLTYEVFFGKENPPTLVASDNIRPYYSDFTVESQETYYWKVIAKDEIGNRTEGDVWTFTMGNFPPEIPKNPIPASNSIEQNPTTISWECTEPDGETLSYDIYFGTTDTPELIEEDYTTNSYELPTLTGNQKYYWRIIAKDTYGNEITGSLWNFSTDIFAPQAIYPINNEQNAAWFPKLTWTSNNAGSITYDVYLGTSNNPELLTSNLTHTTYHSDRLTKEQVYYWKVSAKNENGVIAESPVWSFKVFGEPELSVFFDVRDNKTYQTVKIGNQTWFAENLKYNLEGSRVYDDDPANEDIYGRLYTWKQMMNGEESSNSNPSGVQGIAPPGAHIPSKTEWLELVNFLDGINLAGKYLKDEGTEFWNEGNEGTNESGFSARGGAIYHAGYYSGLKGYAFFWSCYNITAMELYYAINYISFDFSVWSNDALTIRCIVD